MARRASENDAHPVSDQGATEDLVPYIRPEQTVPEFTVQAVVLGAVLSLTFGMVNAYLGLKVGLTVSASIPSAVISMTVLRGILRRGTILENNIVHTIASTGESLAAGVIFTVPALIFLGLAPSGLLIFLLGATGGLLGILMMIPLRRNLTIREHATLPFPEGTACAKVLIAGDTGGASARPVFVGIGLGAAYQFIMKGLHLWQDTVFWSFARLHKAAIGFELTPIFLGVGYLIGPRIASFMLLGGVLAWSVLIPLFDSLAGSSLGQLFGLGDDVHQLTAFDIWRNYVRYVGAGAVATGGMVSLVQALPAMRQSLSVALVSLRAGHGDRQSAVRTEQDLPPSVVVGGTVALWLALWLIPTFHFGLLEALLAVGFAFVFVVVSSRMVGLIGSTSQPVSGMTISALLATSLILAALGRTGPEGMGAAITCGAVVCIAIALSGDMSQDLKTGALLGATPRYLQLGEMLGTCVAALRAGWVLFLLHQAYTLGSEALPAPQAKLMATLVQGVMHGDLPWALMTLGGGLALAVEVIGVPSLAFAIGLYLPVTTSASLILGGLVSGWVRRQTPNPDAYQQQHERATLFASGLIAGDALMGIGIAGLVVSGLDRALALRPEASGPLEYILTIIPFALLTWGLLRIARRATQSPS
ncbi:MAG TPA: oligopeptide transporter, OPT family [Candidatus Binatia bacterium]|jgi:putative OPT family oligopeptide transporter|nr:oligopeptide transporter, OPT family [Candidatus Binatia bacterium]